MEPNIYWEKQSGDLCRMHSLNAYFGYNRLNKSTFIEYCSKYDTVIKGIQNETMDGFSEGRCIISYVLDIIESKYVFLIPINSYSNARKDINIKRYNKLIYNLNGFFEFNKGHVWYNKNINGNWYKIDSISGVNRINNPTINNNGYLLIIEDKHLYNELYYYIQHIYNNDSNDSNDLYYIYLYYILKHITLSKIENNSNYNSKIYLLILIKNKLIEFINYNRKNQDTNKHKKTILNSIKLFLEP